MLRLFLHNGSLCSAKIGNQSAFPDKFGTSIKGFLHIEYLEGMKLPAALFIQLLIIRLTAAQPFVLPNSENKVYTDNVVHRIDILLEPDSLTAMYANVNDHEYPCTAVITDRISADTVLQVAVSFRGNTSMGAAKKSFKISFNTFVPGRTYKRLEKMNLNGEHNDPAICRSKAYWETLASMRVPGPRANHYEVYINGNYYGLYVNVEHIDENFVDSRFGNNGGNLYKCTYPADLAYISNNPNDYKLGSSRRVYELQTNLAEDDYSDLAYFINQLNNNNTAQFKDSIERLLNVNSLLRSYAVDIATGHWDNCFFNINNFYLYKNNETGKFEYIPYDTDNTFGVDWFNIDWKTRDMYSWPPSSGNRPLINRLLAQSEYRDRFGFFMGQLLSRMGDTSMAFPFLDSLKARIAPYVVNDTYHSLDYGFSYNDFLNSFDQAWGAHVKDGIKPFIRIRQSATTAQLVPTPVAPIFSETRHVPRFPIAGDSVFIRTWIEDEDPISNVNLTFRWNSGPQLSSLFYDDGLHRDFLAGDGYYGAFAGIANADTLYYQIAHTDPTGRTGREPRSGWKSVVPAGIPFLKINEWMASNTATITDEAGEFDDWMEVYNPLSNDQPLTRIHFSDSLGNPGKWRMPDTTITGNGFLLLWADEDKNQGRMHMNFKFSASAGEEIFVSYFNGENYRILDSVSFGPMLSDRSSGCSPDGVRPMVAQVAATPAASNVVTGIPAPYEGKEIALFPNPATSSFDLLGVHADDEIELRSLTGQSSVSLSGSSLPIDIRQFSCGIYLVSIRSKNGATRHARLTIAR